MINAHQNLNNASVSFAEAVKSAANILLANAGERNLLTDLRSIHTTGVVFATSTYTHAVVVTGTDVTGQPVIRSILKVVDRNRDYSWSDKGLPGPYTKVILMVNSSPIYPQAGE